MDDGGVQNFSDEIAIKRHLEMTVEERNLNMKKFGETIIWEKEPRTYWTVINNSPNSSHD